MKELELSLDPFLEQISQGLNTLSHQQLQNNLMNYARSLPAAQRLTFLENLLLVEDIAEMRVEAYNDPTLLKDAEKFLYAIDHGEFDHAIDVDSLEEVPGWIDDLDILFARCYEAVVQQNYLVAASAYSLVFSALETAEDIACDHQLYSIMEMLLVDLNSARAAYLGAIVESSGIEEGVQGFIETLDHLSYIVAPLSLKDVFENLPDNDEKHNEFLGELMLSLHSHATHNEHDRDSHFELLREACLMRDGLEGLEKLKNQEGATHPEVFFSLITEYASQQDLDSAERTAIEGLKVVKEDHHKAVLCDWLAELYIKDNKNQEAIDSCHEAWRFEPTHERLVHWCSISGTIIPNVQDEVNYLKEKHINNLRLICMLKLLNGDYQRVQEIILAVNPLGWKAESHPGHVAFPFLLIAAFKINDIPDDSTLHYFTEDMKSLFLRWQSTLIETDSEKELYSYLDFLQMALEKYTPSDEERQAFIRTLQTVIIDRVQSVIENELDYAYEKVANMVVAFAEASLLNDQLLDGLSFITRIRKMVIKEPLFRSELRHMVLESPLLPHMTKNGEFLESKFS